jgi:hypothetical protein
MINRIPDLKYCGTTIHLNHIAAMAVLSRCKSSATGASKKSRAPFMDSQANSQRLTVERASSGKSGEQAEFVGAHQGLRSPEGQPHFHDSLSCFAHRRVSFRDGRLLRFQFRAPVAI